jgi:hypothetical protein
MDFKKFIQENHPDPDTLIYDKFEQMCLLSEQYAMYKSNKEVNQKILNNPC